MAQPNESAFAKAGFYHPDSGLDNPQEGLTKREYFAAMAMQGMLANSAEGNTEWNYDTMAKHCCIAADALVEQLNIKNK